MYFFSSNTLARYFFGNDASGVRLSLTLIPSNPWWRVEVQTLREAIRNITCQHACDAVLLSCNKFEDISSRVWVEALSLENPSTSWDLSYSKAPQYLGTTVPDMWEVTVACAPSSVNPPTWSTLQFNEPTTYNLCCSIPCRTHNSWLHRWYFQAWVDCARKASILDWAYSMVEALANNKQDIVMLEKTLLFWACNLQMFTVGKLSGWLVQKLDNAWEIPGCQ